MPWPTPRPPSSPNYRSSHPTRVTNSGAAYALAKRANILRVQAASVEWGDRGARLNSLSPGIIMTPLAMDELNSPAGAAYQQMIQASAAGRVGTPDEIGATAAFLDGARRRRFITGTDLLIDGGVIASIATTAATGYRARAAEPLPHPVT